MSTEGVQHFELREGAPLVIGRAPSSDIAIFDPNTVNAEEPEWANDFPANTKRMVQRAVGMHYTIVNGTVINDQGRMTGELPGHVLRGPLYRQQKAAA